jgi:hypothetical protein
VVLDSQQQRHEQVVIPEGFPMELLGDTVEGPQLLLLQQQREEAAAAAQASSPAATAVDAERAADAQQQAQEQAQAQQEQGDEGPVLPLVEVTACWSLSVGQHVDLARALLQLAGAHASLEAAASWHPDASWPPELQQGASALANVIAGAFVTFDAAGHLVGYQVLGYVAVGFFGLTVLLAAELRNAAPHVADASKRAPSAPAAAPAKAAA